MSAPPAAGLVGVAIPPCATDPARHGSRGLVDRELSWLAFNARVLQEASDPRVPLFERIRFLGIFSSNLDEFFRVRVAGLRSLLRLKKKRVRRLSLDPAELLSAIHDVVTLHHTWFARLLREEILPELAERGIDLVDDHGLAEGQRRRVAAYFERSVRDAVEILPLDGDSGPPHLDNHAVYLAVESLPTAQVLLSHGRADVTLVRVPSDRLGRFAELPGDDGRTAVMFLDDIVRLHVADLFPERRIVGAWAIAVSRDAELYLEDEFAVDVVEAIRRSLSKRNTGALTRFLYDPETPVGVMKRLEETFALEPEDLVENGRYPNLQDLEEFPQCGVDDESFPPWPPLPHPSITSACHVRDAIDQADQLLHFPYQSYDEVVRFLLEAATDPKVESIRLTVYRVSAGSAVLRALLDAAERGKDVRVFVEAKARFDEASNLEWAERLEAAGIVTNYSFPDLKVHAKVALVVRRDGDRRTRYAFLGTGNFNEETARFYTDFGLLTADPDLGREVERIFHFLEGRETHASFQHLLVAPFNLRSRLDELMRDEIARARAGESASITFKVNGLEDEGVIDRLCEAAREGVKVRGIVRGICRLVPEEKAWGETLQLRSIVDRFLEHGRAYVFGNGGDPLIYLASADWMHRNLEHRVEVAFPIRDPACRAEVLRVLELQLADNRKARRLTAESHNGYVVADGRPVRAQEAIYRWLESRT